MALPYCQAYGRCINTLTAVARSCLSPAVILATDVPHRLYSTGNEQTVSFGFQEIKADEKSERVGQVFSSVASSYDTMNDLMSGGLHRLWKERLVTRLQPFAEMRHLDMAGGTGDVAFRVLREMREDQIRQQKESDSPSLVQLGQVHVCDINPDMLQEGQRKAQQQQLGEEGSLAWVVGDAEQLPFQDGSMDAYTIAFGIRNVTNIDAALAEAFRLRQTLQEDNRFTTAEGIAYLQVLKKGGAFHCLEFSQLALPGLRELYDAYSFQVIPQIGRIVANDEASYQYLVESIRRFPDQKTFAALIRDARFSGVSYENLSGGICAIHSGFKL